MLQIYRNSAGFFVTDISELKDLTLSLMICLLEASSSYKINIIVYDVTQGGCKNSIFILRRNPSGN